MKETVEMVHSIAIACPLVEVINVSNVNMLKKRGQQVSIPCLRNKKVANNGLLQASSYAQVFQQISKKFNNQSLRADTDVEYPLFGETDDENCLCRNYTMPCNICKHNFKIGLSQVDTNGKTADHATIAEAKTSSPSRPER